MVRVGEEGVDCFTCKEGIKAAAIMPVSDSIETFVSVSDNLVLERMIIDVTENNSVISTSKVVGIACDICDSIMKDTYRLNRHKKIHVVDESKVYVCSRCSRVCFDSFSYKCHMKVCPPYSCTYCSFTNNNKSRVEKHVRRHHKYDHLL